MKIQFIDTTKETLEQYFAYYVSSLSSPIDSFLEQYILNSDFLRIELDEQTIGYAAVHQQFLITQFYLTDAYKPLGQEVYHQLKKTAQVKEALVPTCDEFFLSHALESNRGFEFQAYIFQDCKTADQHVNELAGFELVLASQHDIFFIKENSGDFFTDLEKHIEEEEIYIGLYQGERVSFGIIQESRICTQFASIGMYVIEGKKQLGFAVKTLFCLKNYCYNRCMYPVAGCWYYNHNAKKALNSAAMFANTRLLKIQL
ncbi:hypothetical protein [Psychromonas aquimarina]|uniref:hypothetical protein n=1 Tax=Psychromonas aquimarina TaxID=444919 RepID=UPI0003F8A390|nr:hypothetical protein [Psychromonas aquimarina]